MATETIYTVSLHYDTDYEISQLTIGSYRRRGRALDECVDYILAQIDGRDDVAYAVAHDENNPIAGSFMADADEGWAVTDPIALRQYIRDVLSGDCCYYVLCGNDSYHFNIDENDLED